MFCEESTAKDFFFSFPFPSTAIRIKKPIKTKFRLPVFNWTALKPNQINGTVFNEIDDERVLEASRADKPEKQKSADE